MCIWNLLQVDHILGLGKFKTTEITSSIFSDHNAVRLHVKNRKKSIKTTNIWRLNNTVQSNQQITEEIFLKKVKIGIEINENENTTT